MKKVFESIQNYLEQDQDVVLVTIIAGSGSTPRGAGARMWVASDESCHGTIGGGSVEHQAYLKSLQVLKEKQSVSQGYNLGNEDVANIGMVCGGQVVVYFQYISHDDQGAIIFIQHLIAQCERDEDAWMIMDITDQSVWDMGLYTRANGMEGMEMDDVSPLLRTRAVRVQAGDKLYYSEPLVKSGVVYVFGGGHVAQELVPVLTHLDFKCMVLDDREAFANQKVFPDADQVILCDFQNIAKDITITPNDYIVIMTRGHQHDYEVQAQALPQKPCYVGIMGSKHKIAFVTKKLMEDGFTKEEIEACYMPIGTDIEAETPAEIAISVAGELILVRAKRKRGSYE
ncbi:MAG: XdhC family protein [Lachnospiraceae bacterium]